MSVSVLAIPAPADGQTAGNPTFISAFFKIVGPPSHSLVENTCEKNVDRPSSHPDGEVRLPECPSSGMSD